MRYVGQLNTNVKMTVLKFGLNRTLVRCHQLLDDGKSYPGTAMLSRAGFLTTIKALENMRQVFYGQAFDRVAVTKPNSLRTRFHTDHYITPMGCVPGCVVSQVAKYTREAVPVCRHHHRFGRYLHVNMDISFMKCLVVGMAYITNR
jgi:hypothetical protein